MCVLQYVKRIVRQPLYSKRVVILAQFISIRVDIPAVTSDRSRIFRSSFGNANNITSSSIEAWVDFESTGPMFPRVDVLTPGSSPVGFGVNLQSIYVDFSFPTYHVVGKRDFDHIQQSQYWNITVVRPNMYIYFTIIASLSNIFKYILSINYINVWLILYFNYVEIKCYEDQAIWSKIE